jgi:DHA1 family bicyclomycin/chloramphenicol resistance-like MFS transporter
MHRMAHVALVAFIGVTGLHAALAFHGTESLLRFAVLQSATMACFGLAIAGSAASIQGVISTIGGAAVASLIGHQWSGSVFFLPAGALCCGIAALGCVLIAEKARLFRNHPHVHG